MRVLNRSFGHPLNVEERASLPLAGGILQHGYQCGMIWGATLSAGAQAYRLFGPGPQAEIEAISTAQRLVESFRVRNNHINCLEITGIDKSSSPLQMIVYFLIKGGTIGCFRRASKFASIAVGEINTSLSQKQFETLSSPVSCSAILAKKMGLSDLHAAMAAGLAGGIGLCGGACGALGTAIWGIGMHTLKERSGDNLWKDKTYNAKVDDLINRFLKCTDYEFECTEIVGRRFGDMGDLAEYLQEGGCSEIIEVLADENRFGVKGG